MKQFLTLLMIMLSATTFSQTMIVAETFPTDKFNSSAQGGQSGSFTGTLTGWSLKSSTNSIVQVENAPSGGTTNALRFAAGGNGSNNNPRVDTAASANIDISGGSCSVSSMSFQFNWYVSGGQGSNYEVNLQFSGDGGSTWNTVWSNTNLPTASAWNTVVVAGGIPNTNSYWGSDFRFRFTARRSSGPAASDIWFDDIQIFATSIGPAVPYFAGTPTLVQGTDLQPGAVYLYQDVISFPETMDALVKIEVDSNAHVSLFDNNTLNPGRFQPRVANDGSLGNGSETSDRGWVQFSITFIKDNSYVENNPSTDADDSYVTRSLTGLRYQHYDVDGFVSGSGSGAGSFREIGCLSNFTHVYVSAPTHLQDGGSYSDASYTWREVQGQLSEHVSVSSDPDVTFIATYGVVSVVRFRLGFEFIKGNGGQISNQDREYGTEFTCLSFAQQSTLPVKLLNFTGSYRNQVTSLNWETENEQNLDHFEIERSNSGSGYAVVGSKSSVGNSFNRQSYQYTDDLSSVSGNVFYYRLKIVDKDGQFKYSNVIMIRKESKTINGIAINPNPVVNGMVTVRFTATGNKEVSFKVIDMTGKVVLKQQNRIYDGNNSISINNLDRLHAGVYLLQMADSEETTSIKFSIAR
jgi:Secretion system C-terminal sorting domain